MREPNAVGWEDLSTDLCRAKWQLRDKEGIPDLRSRVGFGNRIRKSTGIPIMWETTGIGTPRLSQFCKAVNNTPAIINRCLKTKQMEFIVSDLTGARRATATLMGRYEGFNPKLFARKLAGSMHNPQRPDWVNNLLYEATFIRAVNQKAMEVSMPKPYDSPEVEDVFPDPLPPDEKRLITVDEIEKSGAGQTPNQPSPVNAPAPAQNAAVLVQQPQQLSDDDHRKWVMEKLISSMSPSALWNAMSLDNGWMDALGLTMDTNEWVTLGFDEEAAMASLPPVEENESDMTDLMNELSTGERITAIGDIDSEGNFRMGEHAQAHQMSPTPNVQDLISFTPRPQGPELNQPWL